MPGVSPDALDQVKRAFKGIFRKNKQQQKPSETSSQSTDGTAEFSRPESTSTGQTQHRYPAPATTAAMGTSPAGTSYPESHQPAMTGTTEPHRASTTEPSASAAAATGCDTLVAEEITKEVQTGDTEITSDEVKHGTALRNEHTAATTSHSPRELTAPTEAPYTTGLISANSATSGPPQLDGEGDSLPSPAEPAPLASQSAPALPSPSKVLERGLNTCELRIKWLEFNRARYRWLLDREEAKLEKGYAKSERRSARKPKSKRRARKLALAKTALIESRTSRPLRESGADDDTRKLVEKRREHHSLVVQAFESAEACSTAPAEDRDAKLREHKKRMVALEAAESKVLADIHRLEKEGNHTVTGYQQPSPPSPSDGSFRPWLGGALI
ncbi:hypothetical protein B0A49_12404 [Cryomyces minteri]|uniref:Uncharacterized protein n=1 Tax=Cryomyces minteri TaxID=331657 RepID=A0A4V5NB44_9PEZI|nr:hypothetical protein B0A49_12404 [Cryomyces minteri]